jgi:hypothetical protein
MIKKERIKMKKHYKLLVAMLFAIGTVFQLGAGFSTTANDPFTYQSTNCPDEILKISLNEYNLMFEKLPTAQKYDFVWLKVKNNAGAVVIDNISSRQQLIESKQAINLSGLNDGNYYIEVYCAPERYTTYNSYLWGKDLAIQINDKKIQFQKPN